MNPQIDLFGVTGAHPPAPPSGFRYQPDLLSSSDETALVAQLRGLELREFEFHGYTGKRRVKSFGWKYDFSTRQFQQTQAIPAFLLDVRARAAAFAGVASEALEHVLVTEYGAGAAIGWHRDKDVFDEIIGISLLAPCTFRLRRTVGERWERVNLAVEPRSVYLLSGEARSVWEHSIPPVDALRYSLTFRTLGTSIDRQAGRLAR